jgi:hypothetical protein
MKQTRHGACNPAVPDEQMISCVLPPMLRARNLNASCPVRAVRMTAPVATADWSDSGRVTRSRACERKSLMNAKILLPVLIALHLIAVALIIDGLRDEDQESGRRDQAFHVVEQSTDCVARHVNDEFARYWSSEHRQLATTGPDQRNCVNYQ